MTEFKATMWCQADMEWTYVDNTSDHGNKHHAKNNNENDYDKFGDNIFMIARF